MKNYLLCISAFLFILCSLGLHKVQASDNNTLPDSMTLPILLEAHQLAEQYGIRPYWHGKIFSKGEIPSDDVIPDIIAHLIPCENVGRLLHPGTIEKIIDSNGLYSYGILMIQHPTWDGWSTHSGIIGDPINNNDAIHGAFWAIQHGELSSWSCASILHMVQ